MVNSEPALVQLDKGTSSKIHNQNLSRNVLSKDTKFIQRRKGNNQKKKKNQNFEPIVQQLEAEI